MATNGDSHSPSRLSWKEGLFLVGPDPLTSPYYSSGALIAAGVGFATPIFQIGLYGLLFFLAPLYIEAVLLTLSNGGTYVMTRYALSHLGRWAIPGAALVGIVISFSYVATAIVSMMSYSDYVRSLTFSFESSHTQILAAVGLSLIPSIGFGVWVMPKSWREVLITVGVSSIGAIILGSVLPASAIIMFAPLVMLFTLNNRGLKESVQVSKSIFLINLIVMGLTIALGVIYLIMYGADWTRFVEGASYTGEVTKHLPSTGVVSLGLPGLALLSAPLALKGIASSILGASGVESVMNIPEELERPRRDIPKIYLWMLTTLFVVGASISMLLFLILTPKELAMQSNYLISALGHKVVTGVLGSSSIASVWEIVIVANAALMLIGATNTGFAGARGLWLTMAKDDLLPRSMLQVNFRGAFQRIHWMMLLAIFLLAMEADWDLHKLERWYGASFGLVMFSGMVAFILLRKYKAKDRRVYRAPININVFGTQLPLAAIIGVIILGYALLGMYTSYLGEIGELRMLVTMVGFMVGCVLLLYNHRPILRSGWLYFRRVIETVESTAIETEDRTIVVAVGGARIGRLLQKAISLARQQSKATGIPYRQLVVFHMSPLVGRESVYQVEPDSVRPSAIAGSTVRIFTELTQLAPPDMTVYLAVVPPLPDRSHDDLNDALNALVEFHHRHNFKGHVVIVGTHEFRHPKIDELQDRMEGSTLVPVPLFGDER